METVIPGLAVNRCGKSIVKVQDESQRIKEKIARAKKGRFWGERRVQRSLPTKMAAEQPRN
jgi:hypothetical protein